MSGARGLEIGDESLLSCAILTALSLSGAAPLNVTRASATTSDDLYNSYFANVLDGLAAAGDAVEHVSVLQGTKAYGYHLQKMRVPAKESQPRVEHENFYWEQEDLLTAASRERGFGYTIKPAG